MNEPRHQPDSNSHFDASARDWDQRPMSQQLATVAQRLLQQVPFAPHERVLDFGAGTGLLATAIAPHVAQVTAVDHSANMLAVLREKNVSNIDTVQQAGLQGLPAGHYDAIVSCMALHHVPDTAALLQGCAQTLRPGGRIALVDLYAEDGSFHGDNAAKGVHHLGFDPQALQALARQAGFEQVQLEEIHRLTHRNGRDYPLFLLTARRS